MDTCGLTITVPLLELISSGRDLWLITGSIGTDEIDHGPSTVARDQIAAIARILRRWHDHTHYVEPFPTKSLKHRRQDRNDLVVREDVQEAIHVLEVRGPQLIEVPTW